MKVHKVTMHQEFNAPVEKVWAEMNDHVKMGKLLGQSFTRIVDSPDTDNPNGVGSVRRINIPLIGFEETVRKSEKNKLIEYQISKGTPFQHHYGSMVFKSLSDNKSSLDYSIEMGTKIPLLGGIVTAAVKSAIGGSIRKYAKRLG